MRYSILMLLAFVASTPLLSQEDVQFDIDSTTKRIYFQRVVELPDSVGVSELISRSNEWIVKTYKESAKAEGDILLGKGGGRIFAGGFLKQMIDLVYFVKIEHKTNRMRITFSDIDFHIMVADVYGTGAGTQHVILPCENRLFSGKKQQGDKPTRAETKKYFVDRMDSFEQFHKTYKPAGKKDGW